MRSISGLVSESLLDGETDLAKTEVLKMMYVKKRSTELGGMEDVRPVTTGLAWVSLDSNLMLMETRQAHWPE